LETYAKKNRKLVILSEKNIKKWNGMSNKIMTDITYTKTDQCEELKKLLQLTKKAELWHLVTQRGQKSRLIRFTHLEDIRLKENNSKNQLLNND
jgi:hypothetical protein